MPVFTHNGVEVKYHAVAGYITDVHPNTKEYLALSYEHMHANYPCPKWELPEPGDTCEHSEEVQRDC
jgi:hypothetical protein